MDHEISFRLRKPDELIAPFVESFWMLRNDSNGDKEIVVLPDGRIDLIFSYSAAEPFHITLSGLETRPDYAVLGAGTLMFAISFKLPATEYILGHTIAAVLDYAVHLPGNFWGFDAGDLASFEQFCEKAGGKIASLLPLEWDSRKLELFRLIYESEGALAVEAMSRKVYWSSRQIARYFKEQFGLSLKVYCNILRFSASLRHIAEGKFTASPDFTDQSHFIREVKRFSGVSPKELRRNKDDRFIQLSAHRSK